MDLIRQDVLHSHNTCNKDNFRLPRVKRNWGKQRTQNHAVSDFNSLSQTIKDSRNVNSFKRNVFKEFDENDSDINFTGFEARWDEESHSKSEETSSETSEDSIEAETPWRIELSNFEVSEFSEPALRFNLQDDAKAERYFLNVFGEQTVDLIVEETNQYAHQSLRNNPARLATWKNVSKEELKAYFGVCVIVGINQLPRIADYWKDNSFTGNTGIKQTMTWNRFQEIFQLLHSADSMRTPARGENGYDRLYKVRAMLFTQQTYCHRRGHDCF